MINQDITSKLVKIYFVVCEKYKNELQYCCQRFTNNNTPEFTDQEIMTIYLFSVHLEQRFRIKQMYDFIKNYFASWFPKLPSYVAFNTRINNLCEAFRILSGSLLQEFAPMDASKQNSLLDSMPIITCSGKRNAKVAGEITDKGYCSTKSMYYHGLKLHALGFEVANQMPHPESIVMSKASANDLAVFKENWGTIKNRTFFGDKIYVDKTFFEDLSMTNNSQMLTPVKAVKGKSSVLVQMDKAYDDLFSKAVSTVRQPIESFFNWLIEKTDIQRASKVRSTKGLLVHVFGKLSAAFLKPIFNS